MAKTGLPARPDVLTPRRSGVQASWHPAMGSADYQGYPEYTQLHGAFEHGVSVVDLLFNTGTDAATYMKPLMP